MSTEDHSRAGEGTVLLDIGGEIGALVLRTSAALDGAEIEIVPCGSTPPADPHGWSREHAHPETGTVHDGRGGHHRPHLLHVGVHRRPGARAHWAAVFPELHAGSYDLRVRPDGPIRLSVRITGGQVTEADWPEGPAPAEHRTDSPSGTRPVGQRVQ